MIVWLIKNKKILFLALIIIAFAGFTSYSSLHTMENPDVQAPIALVVTKYPGATPETIDKFVTAKLEERINEIEGIKDLQSYSSDNVSVIRVELEDGQDIKEKWKELKDKVSNAKSQLPTGVNEPEVNDKVVDTYAYVITLASDHYDNNTLKTYAKRLKNRLTSIKGISEVAMSGDFQREVSVKIDWQKLSLYNISLEQIITALQARNVNIPGGTFNNGKAAIPVVTKGEYESVAQIRNTVVNVSEGNIVYLGDIAEVAEIQKKPDIYVREGSGQAIALSVKFMPGVDNITLGKKVLDSVAEFKQDIPSDIRLTKITDQPAQVALRVDQFLEELLGGIIVVVLVMLLGMGVRNALTVSIAIPLTILLTFTVMNLLNITIHQISIAGLIIVLGIIVDNSIVVIDNIQHLVDHGKGKLMAVTEGTSRVITPVLTATLITIAAFLPVMFMSGVIGDFIRTLPQVVIISLSASFIVAIVVVPVSSYFLVKKSSDEGENQKSKQGKLLKFYQKILEYALTHSKGVLGGIILLLIAALAIIPNLPLQFFPKAERPQFVITVMMPEGSSLNASLTEVKKVEKILLSQKDVSSFLSVVGDSLPHFYYALEKEAPSAGFSQIVVNLNDKSPEYKSTSMSIARIKNLIDDKVAGARIEVKELEQGPPVGAPIVIRVKGDDPKILRDKTEKLLQLTRTVKGTDGVYETSGYENNQLQVKIDTAKAALVGLSTYDIALAVRAAVDGVTATTFKQQEDSIDVNIESQEINTSNVERLNAIYFKSRIDGKPVPFTQVAAVYPVTSINKIQRYNTRYATIIKSYLKDGYNAATVLSNIKKQLSAVNLPQGYVIEYAGENAERDNSFASLGQAMIIALLIIYLLMVIQFKSLGQPLIVMVKIPLALIGATLGLLITGQPLGFMAILGFLSLCGVVINHSVVLINYINAFRTEGLNVREAVVEASVTRLRPITLTAVTAIVGIMPLTFKGGNLWEPLGVITIFGLFVSTLMTLIVIPVLYNVVYNKEKKDLSLHSSVGM